MTSLESEAASTDEVLTLKGMLATISERNSQMEVDLAETVQRLQAQSDSLTSVEQISESMKSDFDTLKAENAALSSKNTATADGVD